MMMQVRNIKTVVVSCKHSGCGYEARIPVDRVGFTMNNNQYCPQCRGVLWPTTQDNGGPPFLQLQNAIRRIGELEAVSIEFIDTPAA
jgi:hypothetical protein